MGKTGAQESYDHVTHRQDCGICVRVSKAVTDLQGERDAARAEAAEHREVLGALVAGLPRCRTWSLDGDLDCQARATRAAWGALRCDEHAAGERELEDYAYAVPLRRALALLGKGAE